MGAQLVVEFEDGYDDSPNPMVYLHWGGEHYKDVCTTLDLFLDDVRKLVDKRLDDASYLAAKLVVWAANDMAMEKGSIDFLGVGVVTDDGWGTAHAVIDCTAGDGRYVVKRSIEMERVR